MITTLTPLLEKVKIEQELRTLFSICQHSLDFPPYTVQLGAIHKGRPQPRGEGGLVKSGHMRTQGGGGGLWQKADVLKSKFLPKFSKLKQCPVC